MDVAHLESFIQIAHSGSFRKAARALHLSQPSLSARIKSLEAELRAPLFHRLGHGVRLSEAGEALMPYAEQVLEVMHRAEGAVGAVRDSRSGVLTIATARAIGTYVLPEILKAYYRQHPGVRTQVRTGRSSEIMQMVLKSEADVGLTRYLVHPDLVTTVLYEEPTVLVTHPRHRFALAGSATLVEAAQEPLIIYDPGNAKVAPLTSSESYLARLAEACRDTGTSPNVLASLDSIEAIKRTVALGMGVTFLPYCTVSQEAHAGVLAIVPLPEAQRTGGHTCLLMRRGDYYRHSVRAFCRMLCSMYGVRASSVA